MHYIYMNKNIIKHCTDDNSTDKRSKLLDQKLEFQLDFLYVSVFNKFIHQTKKIIKENTPLCPSSYGTILQMLHQISFTQIAN